METLEGKTLFITGASRGIGLAIALRAARDGANIVIAAKTTTPHPKLEGTIYTAAEAIEKAGGKALACQVDIRSEEQVQAAVTQALQHFGGIDMVINNASAISLTSTEQTPMKRYDLMHQINARGTFLCTQACLPALKESKHGHVLMLAPPLNMEAKWFGPHVAYTMSKYGMSMCVLGMAEEFKNYKIGVNALWPASVIATAAISNVVGDQSMLEKCRKPEIVADAAYAILTRHGEQCTGNFFLDEHVLRQAGCDDFNQYAVKAGENLLPDFFI